MIPTKELDQVKKIQGKVRGTSFKNDFDYVRKIEGEARIKEIKAKLKELGCQDEDVLKERIGVFSWYPLWYHVLFFVILNREMGWREKDIFNIGYHGSQVSLVAKTFPRFMFNLEKAFAKVGTYWKKSFTVGKLETQDFDLEKKYAILNLKDFNVHPLECYTIKGYFSGMLTLLTRAENVKVKETKCVHKGDNYHQFKITWE